MLYEVITNANTFGANANRAKSHCADPKGGNAVCPCGTTNQSSGGSGRAFSRADSYPADTVTTGSARITSYNVCYTKLLRHR